MKPQQIRLLDVVAIGPLMIYGGYKLQKRSNDEVWGQLLLSFGVLTIGYNLYNYIKAQSQIQE